MFPAPVLLPLGGTPYLVGQLTVADWAALTRYVLDHHPHPLDEHRAEVEALAGDARRVRLMQLAVAAERWPPRYPGPEADALLCTVAGLAFWLGLVLSKHQAVDAAELVRLARSAEDDPGRMTWEEFAAVRRAADGQAPAAELQRRLYPEPPGEAGEDPWAARVRDLAAETGWTLDYIGSLTIGQFLLMATGRAPSVPAPRDLSHLSEEEFFERLARERADLAAADAVGGV